MLNNVIDLSHHNTIASFSEAKLNGIVGVIHKATEGKEFVDAKYHSRRQRALANGLLWGAYHFANKGNVERQVDHFMETVNPLDTDLLVLDFEPNGESGTMTVTEAERFVILIKEATGRYPGLYTGQSFIREKLGNRTDTVLSECFLWIARYSNQFPVVPPAWETFTFWQYTDGNAGPQPHQVPGIGRCDRNKFNGDIDRLQHLWRTQTKKKYLRRELNLSRIEKTETEQSPGDCLSFSRAGMIVQQCADGPHDIDKTLEEVGIFSEGQLAVFQECVCQKVLDNGCQISRADIPSSPDNTLREVRDTIAETAE